MAKVRMKIRMTHLRRGWPNFGRIIHKLPEVTVLDLDGFSV